MRSSWPHLSAAVALAMLLVAPDAARADGTVFVGSALNPNTTVRGVSVGITILVVGVEVEYSVAAEDLPIGRPARHEGSASLLAQTPTGRFRLYGLAGVGLYRERVGETTVSNGTSFHVGGGAKIGFFGPLGLRVDYRISTQDAQTERQSRHRVYAGVNVGF